MMYMWFQVIIQVTVESPEGEILTQIRHIESTGADYDRLNYLNALSRYVCAYNPDDKELVRRYKKVIARPEQSELITGIAQITGGTAFYRILRRGYAGCSCLHWLSAWWSFWQADGLVSGRATRWSTIWSLHSYRRLWSSVLPGSDWEIIRTYHDRNYHAVGQCTWCDQWDTWCDAEKLYIRSTGSNEFNAWCVLALLPGIALAMLLMGNISAEGFDVNKKYRDSADFLYDRLYRLCKLVQNTGKEKSCIPVSGHFWHGGYIYWCMHGIRIIFSAIVAASCFVAGYAFIMSRIDHAPSTVFLTASVFPLMPGARLYYLMYGVVSRNFSMAAEHARVLLENVSWYCIWILLL